MPPGEFNPAFPGEMRRRGKRKLGNREIKFTLAQIFIQGKQTPFRDQNLGFLTVSKYKE